MTDKDISWWPEWIMRARVVGPEGLSETSDGYFRCPGPAEYAEERYREFLQSMGYSVLNGPIAVHHSEERWNKRIPLSQS